MRPTGIRDSQGRIPPTRCGLLGRTVAGLLLYIVVAAGLDAEPVTFQRPGWLFSAELPGKPEISENTSVGARGPMLRSRVSCLHEAAVFLVARTSAGFVLSPKAYEESEEAEFPGSAVKTEIDEKVEISGHAGRRLVLVDTVSKLRRETWVFLLGKEMYVFSVQAVGVTSDDPVAKRFFASIRVQSR
ncbi:hypothetical protein DB347_20570 [Opitutaceae bacterium EW11]|nr:hypothetical protein DB347_20570 [Opitutaceae bacterium EW11]